MKFIITISILLFICVFAFNGCDTSDSVATTVTAPSLSTPADNATGVSKTPTFTWTGEADTLEVATNNNFNPIEYANSVSGTQHVFNGQPLAANTTYFWRAGKKSGSSVNWCSVNYRFTTGN